MLPTKSKLPGVSSSLLVCLCVIVLLLQQSTAVVTEMAARVEPVQITPGTSVRAEVTAGAGAVFKITAGKATLLRFSLDKGDLALITTVYGPASAKLIEHVSEEFEGVELSVPADSGGTYTIEIQSREKVDKPRPFELRVESLTPLTPEGWNDSEARKAMATATVLRAQWTDATIRQSLAEYDRATLVWTSLADFSGASQAALRSGDGYFLFSEYAEALKRYQSAATLAAKARDRVGEAKALTRLGRLYSYTGKNDLAEKQLTKAVHVLGPVGANTSTNFKNAYGETLSTMAEVTYAKGNMIKSSEQFAGALEFLQGDRKREAKVHLFAGYIAGGVGVPEKAIPEISRALDLYVATNDKAGEGLALTTLGLSHTFQGKPDHAIELHDKAIKVFQMIGDRHSEAIAFNAVAQVYETLQEYATALTYYEKALQIFHDRGALEFEAGTTFKVARMHRLMKHFDQALTFYERSLQLSRSAKKQRTEINALLDVAIVYAHQNRIEEALQLYRRVQKFYEGIGDRRGQAVALNAQGDFLLQNGKKKEAADTFRRALMLSEESTDKGVLIDTLYKVARAERALGRLEDALSTINRSLKAIEDLRENVGSPEFRTSYFSGVRKNYELCINVLMDLHRMRPGEGFDDQAFVRSEQSRARLLVDLVREAGADLRQDAPKELVIRERELKGLIQKHAQYQMVVKLNRKNPSEIAEVEDQIVKLNSEYQQIQAKLRVQNPRALSLAQLEPLTLKQVQDELRGDDLLLEFSFGEDRSHLWAVTTKSFQSFELPARKEIEDVAVELYKSVTARQQTNDAIDTTTYHEKIEESDELFKQKAGTLSDMLFSQVATQLGTKRLVLVTEGALQLVPFEALPVPGAQKSPNWLISDHEIVQLPSIATLRAIRAIERNDPDAAKRIAAVIADPVFTRNDDRVQGSSLSPATASAAPDANRHEFAQRALERLRSSSGPSRLTHASEEADAIAAAAPRGTTTVAKGFDATRETAMSAHLSGYQILHFATHGHLDNEHPELSGIVLTMVDKNGVEKNGVMPLHDIYSLDLSAELTVLSACQTALGKDIHGEGLVGLAHSFISAGSRSVVASLWKVDDQATATLMAHLYQSMLQNGMSPAAALRAAKLKVMQDKRWNAPYFWAGFVIQGEYTNHIAVENNTWRHLGVVVLLSLLLVSSVPLILRSRRKV